MIVVHNEEYDDLVPAGKKCYLFSGLFKAIEISKLITKVYVIQSRKDLEVLSVLSRATIGAIIAGPLGIFIGAKMANYKETMHFVLELTTGEQIVVTTNDKYLLHFINRYLE